MRILFYVEPFPIRNSLTHFADIARSALGLAGIDPSYDMRLFANKATIAKLGDLAKSKSTFLIEPSADDEALFASHQMSWADGGVNAWAQLIRGEGQARAYQSLVERLWQRFPFDVLVSWGENQAIAEAARRVGAVHLSMELGCTRSPFLRSIIVDPFGTNGNSLPSHLTWETLEHATRGRALSAQLALNAYAEGHEGRAFDQFFFPLPRAVRNFMVGGARKVAFLPLQLYDDANLLVHSHYDTLSDVVRDVVPALADAGWYTIIKPHPDSRHRPNALAENQLAHASISAWSDHFHWVDESAGPISNAAVFNAASLVVTVNSSVGFEALYYDKTVVVLGNASYKPTGIFPTLAEAVSDGFDRNTYLHRTAVLRAFMLEGYLAPENVFANTTAFLQRVTAIAAIAQEAAHDPAVIARHLYETFAPARRQQRVLAMLGGPSRPGVSDTRPAPLPAPAPAPVIVDEAASAAEQAIAGPFRGLVLQRLATLTGSVLADAQIAFLEQAWEQRESRRDLLLKLGCVDKAYLREHYQAIIPGGMDPLNFYLDSGERRGLSPTAKISLADYVEVSGTSNGAPLKDLLVDLIRSAERKNRGAGAIFSDAERALVEGLQVRLREKLAKSSRRVAVVAHLFYTDLVSEVLDAIDNVAEPFDLIVTLPMWGTRETCRIVTERFPDAVLLSLPNCGRDIGPFLEVLPFLIERNYQAVLKVQTKKGYYRAGRLVPGWGDTWRRVALESLAGSRDTTARIVDLFIDDPAMVMVGPAPFCVSIADYPSQDAHRAFWQAAGLPPLKETDAFFAGTMFWVRPSALKPLVDAGVSLGSFGTESGSNDGAIAHDVERYFGQLAGGVGRVLGSDATSGDVRLRKAVAQRARLNDLIGRLHEAREAREVAGKGQLLW